MSTIVSTNFQLPTAVISNGAVTGNEWSNPNNLLLVDGDVSESQPGSVASDVIIGNFNADLPTGAVITGIEIEIFAYRGAQTSPVITLTPVAVDDTSGISLYYPDASPVTSLTPELQKIIVGTPTYLFGTTWTVDQINNFKLQLLANGDIYVDSALLKVYYYIPDPIIPPPGPDGFALDGNSPLQAQEFQLALPFGPADRYMYLYSFNYPDGTPIEFADMGSAGGQLCLVVDPGIPLADNGGSFEENLVSIVEWTTLVSGYVQIDFGTDLSGRGRMFRTPFTSDPNLISGHDQNATVIISNSALFESRFIRKEQQGYVFNGPIAIEDEGVTLQSETASINFIGPGVITTVDEEGNATVTIPGGSGGASTAAPLLVDYTTSTVLPNTPVYNNGTAGIGATLTGGTNAALVVDGITVAVGTLILVKNQSSAFQNGVYVVTLAGNGSVEWVLTRVSNYNTIGQINYSGPVAVLSGTANSLTGWVLTTNTVATIGTSAINYEQYISNATFVTLNGIQTLTNKTIKKRFVSVAQSATPAIDTDNGDIFSIVGLAEAVTSFTSGLTGTPYAGQYIMIQITDNGTPQTLAWGALFANTTVSLPAVTVANMLLRIGLQYDAVSAVWECIAVA